MCLALGMMVMRGVVFVVVVFVVVDYPTDRHYHILFLLGMGATKF
jgi:hypothetical protein